MGLSKVSSPPKNSNDVRANEILEVIMSYARLDFSKKTNINNNGDVFDAIAAGVNMLGEELKSSTISLREKEQLLKEVHHRVKNNLQIISSLLNLQSDSIKDKRLLGLIRESHNRIKSMALVHEMLYTSPTLSQVCFENYISVLCMSIYNSYRGPQMYVNFDFDIPKNITFDIDKMIPLGLILNEIISNSLKYAFDKNKGNIFVSLKQDGEKYLLKVADNGKGLPEKFSVEKDANLGMQLIFMLAEQIDGTAELQKEKGTSYLIYFH